MGFLWLIFTGTSFILGILAALIMGGVTFLIRKKLKIPYVLFPGVCLLFLRFPFQEAIQAVLNSTNTSGYMNDLVFAGLFVPGTVITFVYWLLTIWFDHTEKWLQALLLTVTALGLVGLFLLTHASICFSILMGVVLVSIILGYLQQAKPTPDKTSQTEPVITIKERN